MKKLLGPLIGLSLAISHSAYAFLGMNAGATLQGPLPAWTKQLGARTTPSLTNATAVSTDSSGNIFVAGYTTGDLDGNTRTGTQDFFVTKYDSTGAKIWTKQLGVASQLTYGYGVATDLSGNIFVAGLTYGGLDGNTLTGNIDFFVTKYDSTGAKIWTKQMGVASQFTYGYGVATDSSGNIFVTGQTTGGLDGNTQIGTYDFFVTKYDSTGAKIWTKQLGVAAKNTRGYGVTTDSSGNIFVAGTTSGGLDGNTLTGTQDFFVTKYDSTGAKIWTKQMGVASKTTLAYGVATDPSGNIFVAGYTTGGLDGNTLTGTQDFFVTKYDSTGAKVWTKQLGVASQSTTAQAVSTDSSGNIFVSGFTNGGLDGNTLTGNQDFFVTKYDSTGAKTWTKQLGVASMTTEGFGVATGPAGNILVAGFTTGGLDGNTLTGSQDSFVTQYDSTGSKTWTRQRGCIGPTNVVSNYVALGPTGQIYVAGSVKGGLDGNTLTGAQDLFVTKYDSTGAKTWTKQLGVATKITSVGGVATDPSGNIFVTGYTMGGLDGNTLTGTQDFFVTKYDSTGAKIWTKQLGVASHPTVATGVATDSSGNIFVTGYTMGGLDGNTLTGTQDFFVTKYDSTGAKIWTKQLGVAAKATSATGVATDSSGNIFVTGYTAGGLDGNTLTGTQDFFVTKYDSTGAKIWTKQLGVAAKNTAGNAVATDSSGNIFVAGYTNGGLDGNTLTGAQDFFVTKYDSTGAKIWTKQMGVATKSTTSTRVTTDSSGNIFVAGSTLGGLDGNTLTGTQDFFVTKYDSTGAKIWTKQMGVASQNTSSNGVTTDSSGNIFVAGTTLGGLDGNALKGTQDFFVTKYTASGLLQWTKQLGVASQNTKAFGVAIDSSGRLYVSGTTAGGLDYNTLTGALDLFLSQFIGN